MAVTEVDHQAVKNRIVEMFKADTGIWNENNPLGRARSIDLGVPDGKQWLDIPTPYIRITNAPKGLFSFQIPVSALNISTILFLTA